MRQQPRHFYPRSPCGERLLSCGWCGVTILFLSTLSLRRATRTGDAVLDLAFNISIHALLAESDPRPRRVHSSASKFLSTLSLRRATDAMPLTTSPLPKISIHALLAESDRVGVGDTDFGIEFLSTLSLRRATHCRDSIFKRVNISIHALLAESDQIVWGILPAVRYFYPRSPCGERQPPYCTGTTSAKFLSTLSLRRATVEKTTLLKSLLFLSTLSLRRATCRLLDTRIHVTISIHALLAESDGPV